MDTNNKNKALEQAVEAIESDDAQSVLGMNLGLKEVLLREGFPEEPHRCEQIAREYGLETAYVIAISRMIKHHQIE